MPLYEYQSQAGECYEIWQSIHDEPLTHHPTSNTPIQKIISSPWIKNRVLRRSTVVNKKLAAATPCQCAKHSCHHS